MTFHNDGEVIMTPDDLADAAEAYVRTIYSEEGRKAAASAVHKYASKWSFVGWRVVARGYNPDFEPFYEDMFQAVEILRQRAA